MGNSRFEFRESSGISFVEEVHYRWWQESNGAEPPWTKAAPEVWLLESNRSVYIFISEAPTLSRLGSPTACCLLFALLLQMESLPSNPDIEKLRYSTFSIEATKLGSHILEIAFIEEGSTDLVQLPDSPVLLEVQWRRVFLLSRVMLVFVDIPNIIGFDGTDDTQQYCTGKTTMNYSSGLNFGT